MNENGIPPLPKLKSTKKPEYLCVDTETGGVELNTSLLTVYFLLLDEDLEEIDTLEIYLTPEDRIFHVTGEALGVNKIDLYKHSSLPQLLNYSAAGTKLYGFLSTHVGSIARELGSYGHRVTPFGHNVQFDIRRIQDKLISQSSWEIFVSYRALDTQIAARWMQEVGLLPKDMSIGLQSLVSHFGIDASGAAHTAFADVWMTVDVFKCMKKLAMERIQ